jgi:hypothetical protein
MQTARKKENIPKQNRPLMWQPSYLSRNNKLITVTTITAAVAPTMPAFVFIRFAIITVRPAIPCPVSFIITISPGLINYNLVAAIQIIISVRRREMYRKNPIASRDINELMPGYIVISFDIR